MVFSREHTVCQVEVGKHSVTTVIEAVYLGVKFSVDGRMKGESDRISSAISAVGAAERNVFGKRALSWKAKMEVYNAVVLQMMTYCMYVNHEFEEKVLAQAMEMIVLRRVAGVSRPDCIRKDEIRHRLQQRSIVNARRKRKEGELEVESGEVKQKGSDRGDGRTLDMLSLSKTYPTPYEYSIADVVGKTSLYESIRYC